jgi:hypothetical protein
LLATGCMARSRRSRRPAPGQPRPALHCLRERKSERERDRERKKPAGLIARRLSCSFRSSGRHCRRSSAVSRSAPVQTASNSTSNISVAFGGITPPAPRAP